VTVGPARLAPSHASNKVGYSSELLLFEEGEPPRTVWTSSEELILDLEAEGDKASVLAATGPNGKLYRIGLKGWALERTFDEKQVSAFGGEAVATNSASGLYLLAEGPRSGEYVSAVKDTGRTSRFGASAGGRAASRYRTLLRLPLGRIGGDARLDLVRMSRPLFPRCRR
jgi:hypothetical protein